jgi:hypothetical protein
MKYRMDFKALSLNIMPLHTNGLEIQFVIMFLQLITHAEMNF